MTVAEGATLSVPGRSFCTGGYQLPNIMVQFPSAVKVAQETISIRPSSSTASTAVIFVNNWGIMLEPPAFGGRYHCVMRRILM